MVHATPPEGTPRRYAIVLRDLHRRTDDESIRSLRSLLKRLFRAAGMVVERAEQVREGQQQ